MGGKKGGGMGRVSVKFLLMVNSVDGGVTTVWSHPNQTMGVKLEETKGKPILIFGMRDRLHRKLPPPRVWPPTWPYVSWFCTHKKMAFFSYSASCMESEKLLRTCQVGGTQWLKTWWWNHIIIVDCQNMTDWDWGRMRFWHGLWSKRFSLMASETKWKITECFGIRDWGPGQNTGGGSRKGWWRRGNTPPPYGCCGVPENTPSSFLKSETLFPIRDEWLNYLDYLLDMGKLFLPIENLCIVTYKLLSFFRNARNTTVFF